MSVRALQRELKRALASVPQSSRVVVISASGERREIASDARAFFRLCAMIDGRLKAKRNPETAADFEAVRESVSIEPVGDSDGVNLIGLAAALAKGPVDV